MKLLGKPKMDRSYGGADLAVRRWSEGEMPRKIAKMLGEPKLQQLFNNRDAGNVPDSVAELSEDSNKPRKKKKLAPVYANLGDTSPHDSDY